MAQKERERWHCTERKGVGHRERDGEIAPTVMAPPDRVRERAREW